MLNDAQIAASESRDKKYRLSDIPGLYLLVRPKPKALKSWIIRYKIEGKHREMVLGVYPVMKLDDVRVEAIAKKKLIKEGIDPVAREKEDLLAAIAAREQQEK